MWYVCVWRGLPSSCWRGDPRRGSMSSPSEEPRLLHAPNNSTLRCNEHQRTSGRVRGSRWGGGAPPMNCCSRQGTRGMVSARDAIHPSIHPPSGRRPLCTCGGSRGSENSENRPAHQCRLLLIIGKLAGAEGSRDRGVEGSQAKPEQAESRIGNRHLTA